ncbi:hypothetical protein [Mycobacterium riyadhense]|uniref:Uncharacterized protein n=1 Tax=Mycobacterium riyadhense TaxID=486698 RepID=A0A653EZS5_9MYCO|nr:hypothetical protein [Mycobacterium riyadhense]MCV7147805.1 hypothetical protein [Mycobacterium riyadhense]VTP02833.1 hypothetical protein BIN_B_04730 [Mycobacterium riyadhense]
MNANRRKLAVRALLGAILAAMAAATLAGCPVNAQGGEYGPRASGAVVGLPVTLSPEP